MVAKAEVSPKQSFTQKRDAGVRKFVKQVREQEGGELNDANLVSLYRELCGAFKLGKTLKANMQGTFTPDELIRLLLIASIDLEEVLLHFNQVLEAVTDLSGGPAKRPRKVRAS
jgi:hypothetical protein